MRFLLVVPEFDLEPIGLAYISAALKKAGHEVDCLGKAESRSLSSILSAKKKQYDWVATGGMSCNYKLIKDIIETAKANHFPVILGGGIVTSEPELMVRALPVDYSVLGEGEETIVDLAACIENGNDPAAVSGIAYIRDGDYCETQKRKPLLNLDSLPSPDWDGVRFDALLKNEVSGGYLRNMFDHPRTYPLIASRSCPYLCTFCYHPLGNKYRQRSVDSLMAEIEAMAPKYQINVIGVYDELFAHDKNRVLEFCKRFQQWRSRMPWEVKWNCQLRVDQVSEDLLATLEQSGCHQVSYGFESYSTRILTSMRKNITSGQIHQATHMTCNTKISLQANFIFGDVEETKETAYETLGFWKEHAFAGINLHFVMPYPNSALYQQCLKNGLIVDRLDFIENHLFDLRNMSRMTDREFLRFRIDMMVAFLKYAYRVIPEKVGTDNLKVRCPHCKETVTYFNFNVASVMFAKLPFLAPSRRFFFQDIMCRKCGRKFYAESWLYRMYAWLLLLFLCTPGLYELYLRMSAALRYLREISRKRPQNSTSSIPSIMAGSIHGNSCK